MIFPLNVEYSQQAERDLERITDRLLETSEIAGQRFALALESTLAEYRRGMKGRQRDAREQQHRTTE